MSNTFIRHVSNFLLLGGLTTVFGGLLLSIISVILDEVTELATPEYWYASAVGILIFLLGVLMVVMCPVVRGNRKNL